MSNPHSTNPTDADDVCGYCGDSSHEWSDARHPGTGWTDSTNV